MRYWEFIDEMSEWSGKIIELLNQGQVLEAIREQNSLMGNLLCTYYEHDEWDDSDTRRHVVEKADITEKECLEKIKEAWKHAWPECSEAVRLDEIKSPEKFIPEDIIREMKSHHSNASIHTGRICGTNGIQTMAEKGVNSGQPRRRARERLTYLSRMNADGTLKNSEPGNAQAQARTAADVDEL